VHGPACSRNLKTNVALFRMQDAVHLAECVREARFQAERLPFGRLRDALLEKARQYEAQINENIRPLLVTGGITNDR
jgi:hypothetical protein